MAKNLKQVYENIGKFGALSSPRRLALAANTSQQEAQKFLEKQESYTLHRRAVRPKHFRKTIALYPFEIAQADLMSLDGSYAKHNAPYKFLLVIIDVFSRRLFVKPLKSKHGSEVAKQLEQVFSEQTFKKIHVDRGKEFLNPSVKKTLEKYQIELYHTHSHLKATIVERSIRTLRSHLSAFCTHFNTFSFVPRLDLIVSQYNDSPHRSLGNLAPNQVNLQNTPYISDFMYGKSESKQKKLRNQLQVGQSVRILRGKGIFEKGQFNFSKEIFRIASVQSTDPVTFKLVDLSDEPVLGCFYQSELQKVQEPDEYVIDKVLKRRTYRGVKQLLVSWLGYPTSFNTWINADQARNVD